MTSTLARTTSASLRSPNVPPLARTRVAADAPRPRTHLPTHLRPADLLRITDQGVADVLDGRHDALLPTEWDTTHRWSTRLYADDDLDVWLISWTPGEATELHDHAGSLGALTVLSGSLREYHWTGDDLAVRVLDAGDQAAFPLGWVHDVVKNPTTQVAGPTLSVHAYSPPLTAMSYYEVADAGHLRRTRTILTDEPE
ncbi:MULTISPECIES: cysteine dioxygenase [Gordonia]|uniref:Cysteine dioxygenase n=2 Tax=Gordonia alkanivorans TaxID=84096 RepID=W9DKG0_9ACTN|nr:MULTISPECIES: cysteine dioxygenase family protein [Gordonia]ETA07361.1 cysteine dioxygenase [Gordonia alkanivorans CGMCC 6845]MDH3007738.1 cysteine dioxygenase family protein [Gordonia alkanivorans]MDH3015459.1 cysteine dioxygenase family protein [Gordonia alkanivorans]MDH3020194.1 cysteine dioxygenase family protein [Gordonia alkanivorans]MDH3040392.1 cysteine dioxygenase family protein [Gordonia alkanivorans]